MDDYKRDKTLAEIDSLCGRLADAGDHATCWSIRAVIDASTGATADPPMTDEDRMYLAIYRAANDSNPRI